MQRVVIATPQAASAGKTIRRESVVIQPSLHGFKGARGDARVAFGAGISVHPNTDEAHPLQYPGYKSEGTHELAESSVGEK